MSVPQSILETLQANTAINAALPGRIFSGLLPSGVSDAVGPWLVFERISNVQEASLDGDAGLGQSRYQFTIGSSNKASVDTVRDLLLKLNATSYTAVGGQLVTFFHAGDHEHYDAQARIHTAVIDFLIWANT